MQPNRLIYAFITCLFCYGATTMSAQNKQLYFGAAVNTDVSELLRQQQQAARQYAQRVNRVESIKINGYEYVSYFSPAQGNPYFNFLNLVESTVILTDSSVYQVKGKYDTHLDQLVYLEERTPVNGRFLQIVANKNQVAAFTLGDEFYFEHLSFPGEMMQDGYYEILYRGRSEVIIKHHSEFVQGSTDEPFRHHSTHYVNTGNGYIEITSSRRLMKIFENIRPQMKKYIRSIGVYNLTTASRRQMKQIFEYYDSIEAL